MRENGTSRGNRQQFLCCRHVGTPFTHSLIHSLRLRPPSPMNHLDSTPQYDDEHREDEEIEF